MDIPTAIENRLVDLEIKSGFTEDLLDRLDDLVTRQTLQIEALTPASTSSSTARISGP